MTEPIDKATKDLIEKEAKHYALTKGYKNGVHQRWCEKDYIAGATAWAEKLKQERNKAIDEALGRINQYPVGLTVRQYVTHVINILESLKIP